MTPLLERYAARLPAVETLVSLGEGSTPLLHAPRLSRRLGRRGLAEVEWMNPTGSFKDRGMAVAVSKAPRARARRRSICASTGNTAASAAAYAARAGLPAIVLQPQGAVARGKLSQARALGARGARGARHLRRRARSGAHPRRSRRTHVLVNSVNPYRIEGQKTAAFELVEQLGAPPDVLALPYGGGGNTRRLPPWLHRGGSRAARASSRRGRADRPQTVALAIRIADPAPVQQVQTALLRAHRRCVVSLSDAEILDAWRRLGREEGVFCEPASAAGCGRARARRPRAGYARGLRGHGSRAQGSRDGGARVSRDDCRRGRPGRDRRGGRMRFRAPATTANLGPGFDCAGAALDLWNELELTRERRAVRSASISAFAPSRSSPRPRAGTFPSATTSRASAASARARRSSLSASSPRWRWPAWSSASRSCSPPASSSRATPTISRRRSRAASA